jgi:two-component system chemotaxis response regulator CheB
MPEELSRDVIVIGGSAGALQALKQVLRALPAGLPGALFVVIHTSPDSPGILPRLLAKDSALPVAYGTDAKPIRPGHVYVAPPNHHLLVKPGHMLVTRGPRENRFRPAVDPLFRTAAIAYGSRVVGVILSGAQDDGVSGLAHVKRHGGVAIAQDPDDAETPSMPENAIRQVSVDHVLRAGDIGAVLAGLVGRGRQEAIMTTDKAPARDVAEIGTDALNATPPPGPPSPFTCPECGGALWELRDGGLVRFQCHVGHGFSSESLVAAQSDALEAALWAALRALEESAALRRRMADRARERGMTTIARSYEEHAEESDLRAAVVRRALVNAPAANPDEVSTEV